MSEDNPDKPDPGVAVVGGTSTRLPSDIPPPPPRESGGARTEAPKSRVPRPAQAPTGGWRQPGWLVPLLVTTTVVSLLLMSVFAFKWSDLSAQNDQRATVKTVASDFLLALTNLRPNTLDHDFQVLQGYATGQFATSSNQFFGSSIRQQLEAAQARSDGQIRYLYVQSLQDNQASVYAEVDETYSNVHITTPVSDVLQVVMTMTDTSKGWKISNVTVLQPPSSGSSPTGSSGG